MPSHDSGWCLLVPTVASPLIHLGAPKCYMLSVVLLQCMLPTVPTTVGNGYSEADEYKCAGCLKQWSGHATTYHD